MFLSYALRRIALLARRHLARVDGDLRADPRRAVSTRSPTSSAGSRSTAAGSPTASSSSPRTGRSSGWTGSLPEQYLAYLGPARAAQPRLLDPQLPDHGHRPDPAGAPVDARAAAHDDDHRVHPGHDPRRAHGVAPVVEAGAGRAAPVHAPVGDPVLPARPGAAVRLRLHAPLAADRRREQHPVDQPVPDRRRPRRGRPLDPAGDVGRPRGDGLLDDQHAVRDGARSSGPTSCCWPRRRACPSGGSSSATRCATRCCPRSRASRSRSAACSRARCWSRSCTRTPGSAGCWSTR